MRGLVTACVAACVLAPWSQTVAAETDDAMQWLSRIVAAAQSLDYSGTFIYQSGRNIETSRITHVVDAEGEHERLEVLDGSPREVIRRNDAVWCVFPDQKMVITDRSETQQRSFPARLPDSYASLSQYYRVAKGGPARVAGLDTHLIVLEPRDDLRYAHMLWAESESGLLLKARTVDEHGEIVEQFAFSDISIGGDIDRSALEPRYRKDDSWRVVAAHGQALDTTEAGWRLSEPLPGFELKSVMRRPLGRDQRDVVQLVYGDGLASISVFIEPLAIDAEAQGGLGPLASGSINIYRRSVAGHLLTALGEVPLSALQRIGEAMEPVTQ